MEDDGGESSSFVVGIIENRAKEVGLAAFDLRSASLHLSQYIETSSSYQNTKTLLHFYDPIVIILPPNKLASNCSSAVTELVDRFYGSVRKVVLARGCFDDTKGAILIKNLAAKEPSALGLDTYYKQYYLCLAAAAATLKWTEAEKGIVVTNHSLLVTFNGSFDHMNIDATRTRLLRANLLQPLKDIETINARLDCLVNRVLCHFCFKPKKVIAEALAVERAKKSQVLVSGVILLKTALDALPLLSKVLKDVKSSLLSNIYKSVCENEKYDLIKKRIGEVIDEDVLHARVPFVACTQQCFAVKAGIDGLLDISRRSFCETSEAYHICFLKEIGVTFTAIHNLANTYREDFKLPNLKLIFKNRQGFHFVIPQKNIQGKLPSKFIQLNARNKSAAAECYTRTEVCLEELMDNIRENVSVLTLLAEVLCLLDMIVNSFAHMISTKPVDRYTRPEFTENGPLAIDSGRHPILESIHNDFVANNIFLSEASNMVIVMGPNMSGKSTYLQQLCLIVILAQVGCYVPARFSTLRVVDRMFTRMGAVDNLESNSSTFTTEMKETAFIMQNVSRRSLIVMDELGRATSSTDGFAMAWSCCEHLLSLKAYTIFASHMENISELATIYPNVKILHFLVDLKNNHLDFKVLKEGTTRIPHYGLLLAEVAGLPSSVIETARAITTRIAEKVF
ncbi:DNA mismatch repair protein [Vigna angularis]|uniref:DNA mismatch repair protein n=1 Tax=Phaseolus angularis TaxID=3914 RepID=A0A8T0JIM5_PHAAN|nr:DNA mismatch repair protein [Vigna angularis]